MTNREWLASLNDEDLATALETLDCDACVYTKDNCCGRRCHEGFVLWLKAEHEEG